MSESRSTPITRTCLALPPRTMSGPRAMPWQKPAQAARDVEGRGRSVPSSWAMAVATAGVCSRCETVATMTQSIWAASMPARSRA